MYLSYKKSLSEKGFEKKDHSFEKKMNMSWIIIMTQCIPKKKKTLDFYKKSILLIYRLLCVKLKMKLNDYDN